MELPVSGNHQKTFFMYAQAYTKKFVSSFLTPGGYGCFLELWL